MPIVGREQRRRRDGEASSTVRSLEVMAVLSSVRRNGSKLDNVHACLDASLAHFKVESFLIADRELPEGAANIRADALAVPSNTDNGESVSTENIHNHDVWSGGVRKRAVPLYLSQGAL